MPELPEVETIRQNLRKGNHDHPSLLGMTIINPQLLWARSLAVPSPERFLVSITGQTIREIDRRGKYLVFRLNTDNMLVHLRMSGDICVERQIDLMSPYSRLALDLDSGYQAKNKDGVKWRLVFQDPRKFGRVWFVTDPSEVLSSLGPEPLDPDFRAGDFYQLLQSCVKLILKPLPESPYFSF